VDPERLGNSRGERLDDIGCIEHDANRDGEHHKLHEPRNFAREQEEYRDDTDDSEEQWPEEPLEIGDQILGAERDGGHRGRDVCRHKSSLPGLLDPFAAC